MTPLPQWMDEIEHKYRSYGYFHKDGDISRLLEACRVMWEALEKVITAGRDAYDNGYPEMERAVCEAREALEKGGRL